MTELERQTTRRRAEHSPSSPTAHGDSEPPRTRGDSDEVVQLGEALRAAERAYRSYRSELRQGDVEPAEDWSTWYAEYLLGVR
jgi:hypothetical protein